MTSECIEKHPVWQKLIEDAYVKEKTGKELSDLEYKASLLAALNYQVCNGGFAQWVDNGYGLKWQETVDFLEEIGTKNAIRTINLINSFADYIKDDVEDKGCFGDYWIREKDDYNDYYNEDDEGEEYDYYNEDDSPGREIAQNCDDTYYEFYEALEDEIENFLANGGVPNETPAEGIESAVIRKPVIHGPIDGNAFAILGHVRRALEKTNMDKSQINEILREAMNGDYNHLLRTCMKYVDFDV